MNSTILLLALFAPAADPTSPLTVKKPTRDAGKVNAGRLLSEIFDLKNTGSETVTITDITAGCGCLRPRASARTIEPGSSVRVLLEVNTLSQPEGARTWNAVVKYKCGTQTRELDLAISATVSPVVLVTPVAIGLTTDKAETVTVTLIDPRDKPLNIREAKTSHPLINGAYGYVGSTKAGHEYRISVEVSGHLTAGEHADTLQIFTDDPDHPEFRVPIKITRRDPTEVIAAPAEVDLRFATAQTSVSSLVRLRGSDGSRMAIDRVETDHPKVQAKWAAGPEAMATVRITVADVAIAGKAQVRVHFSSGKTMTIPVRWLVP